MSTTFDETVTEGVRAGRHYPTGAYAVLLRDGRVLMPFVSRVRAEMIVTERRDVILRPVNVGPGNIYHDPTLPRGVYLSKETETS